MRKYRGYLAWAVIFVLTLGTQGIKLHADNTCPIILVHGLLGWGRDEMGGYRYWGGGEDLEKYLREQGFQVFTASISPVASNWDRAVELYYCIKGGQVDYGQSHADQFGIIQKPTGKVYPGLYPEWNAEHPVHLIGHSMGGQTVRMLQFLLINDFYLDSGYSVPEESFLLGQSHSGWIKSITTFSTPHNGTTLTNIITKTMPFLQDIIAVAAVTGSGFYDFDLQQWGFDREKGEPWLSYFQRMREHPAWGTKNISAWDLSLDGARDLNTGLIADQDIYYFSYATTSTRRDSARNRYVPDRDMSLTYQANARLLGSLQLFWSDGSATDSTWFENDGMVNTVSMRGPTTGLNGPDPIAVYNPSESLIPGQWYFMGKLDFDHKQLVGHGLLGPRKWDQARAIFLEQCRLLWTLPD